MKQDDTVLLCTSMQDGKSESLYKHEDSCRAEAPVAEGLCKSAAGAYHRRRLVRADALSAAALAQ